MRAQSSPTSPVEATAMPFKFSNLCDLLETLQDNRRRACLPEFKGRDLDREVIVNWFNRHNESVERTGKGAVAFLSCLFPERRVDRVFGLKEKSLASLLGRCLGFGHQRQSQFVKEVREGQDIAMCVERHLRDAELPMAINEVTLEEIDQALDHVAAQSRFSCPHLRSRMTGMRADGALEPIYRRLQSREAKWLTRMILKNFSPVVVPEAKAMNQFHFLLYDLLSFQNSFSAAIETLQSPSIGQLAPRQRIELVEELTKEASVFFVPKINTFVRRQPYEKARSIKHCCQLTRGRQISLGRKYDGEYCQVHVDLHNSSSPIKIFSKSGKDSTMDRIRIHKHLKKGLRLGEPGCRITSRCILESELLVWNDDFQDIQPFHTIRKHVSRSGSFLGTDQDSPPHPADHLMLVLYDVLLWDEIVCIKEPLWKRRQVLKSLVRLITGRIDITEYQIIDFRSHRAPEKLRSAFANSITKRWEGLILKGIQDPYSVLSSSAHGIKLKKDYIKGLGDTEDFVVIGGRFSQQEFYELERGGIQKDLEQSRLPKLLWTTFFIACLDNKPDVIRWDAKPSFRVVATVGCHSVSKANIVMLNQLGNFRQVSYLDDEHEPYFNLTIDQMQLPTMTTAFKNPFIVEIMGAGFDRPAGVNYPMLRFPRVLKIHEDRWVKDSVSLDELREKAKLTETIPTDDESQVDAAWIERLLQADGRETYIVDHSQVTTPRHASSTSSPASTRTYSTGLTRTKSPRSAKIGHKERSVGITSPCSFVLNRKRKIPEDCLVDSEAVKRQRQTTSTMFNSFCTQTPSPASQDTQSRLCISERTPLSEITNVSPCQQRLPIAEVLKSPLGLLASISCTADDQPRARPLLEKAKNRHNSIPPVVNERTTCTLIHTGVLQSHTVPTQPSSSEETKHPADSRRTESMSNAPHAVVLQVDQSCSGAQQDSPCAMLSHYLASLKQPIFVNITIESPCLAQSILQVQMQSKASFTFSCNHFLRTCLCFWKRAETLAGSTLETSASILHLMLIDQANMSPSTIFDATKKVTESLAKYVRNEMRNIPPDATIRKHALLVADWHILETINPRIAQADLVGVTGQQIEKFFFGSYMWPFDTEGKVGSTWNLRTLTAWMSD